MSAPPTPASATPRARVSEKIRGRLMPIAWAASGLSATARTASPTGWRRRNAKRAVSSAAATPSTSRRWWLTAVTPRSRMPLTWGGTRR